MESYNFDMPTNVNALVLNEKDKVMNDVENDSETNNVVVTDYHHNRAD